MKEKEKGKVKKLLYSRSFRLYNVPEMTIKKC